MLITVQQLKMAGESPESIEVDESATLDELKDKLHEQLAHPAAQQVLLLKVAKGRPTPLEDGASSMKELNIEEGSQLILILKSRQQVQVSGAGSEEVNGVYEDTLEEHQGRKVYAKIDGEPMYIRGGYPNYWIICRVLDSGDNPDNMHTMYACQTSQDYSPLPEGQWMLRSHYQGTHPSPTVELKK